MVEWVDGVDDYVSSYNCEQLSTSIIVHQKEYYCHFYQPNLNSMLSSYSLIVCNLYNLWL